MLELSFGKMMIIAVVALIVLGPEKLPKVARTLGHLLGRARGYANQVKQDIDREMQMDELRKLQEQAKEAARSFESAVNDAGRSVEQEASSASRVFNEMDSDYHAKLDGAVTENSIAAPVVATALTAQDEVAALEKSIAEHAAEQVAATKPMISAEQMTASLPQPHAANLPKPANSVDAEKKVA